MLSRSAVSDPLQPRGLQPVRLLCPWDSPGKNLEWAVIMIIIIITVIPFYLQYKPDILLTLSKFLINHRIGYHFCDNCIIELTESQGIKI